MSGVHSKETNIEVKLRKALWHKGYHYRKNLASLPGKPDIVFTKYRLAIFCDAEFWHGKDWEILKPKLQKGKNSDFWVSKIERNRNRDNENDQQLRYMGWTVLRFWGKEILFRTEECVRVIEETIFDIKIFQHDLEADYDEELLNESNEERE
jgi:DNA mismatch endonuclease (patch repair protein)